MLMRNKNNEIVACSSYYKKGKDLYLNVLATREPGYGKQAMQELINVASQQNLGMSFIADHTVQAFYRKIGFHELKRPGYFSLSADEIKQMSTLKKSLVEITIDDEPEDGVFIVPNERMKSLSQPEIDT